MKLQLILLFVLFSYTAFSQSEPRIAVEVPPSPTAYGFSRYGDYPVDLSTGLPSISIPLVTVKGRSISVPVSLSYHASGVKVNDLASWTGLGWTLQAGGAVSRTMNGLPDEMSQDGFLAFADSVPDKINIAENDPGYLSMLNKLADGVFEMEPDVFSFTAPGISGKFVYGNDRAIYTFPKQAVKISQGIESGEDFYEIRNIDGTIYQFGKSYSGVDTKESTQAYVKGPDPPLYVSSWYLTEIVSADYRDTVYFEYETHNYLDYGINESQSLSVKYNGQEHTVELSGVSNDIMTVPEARKLARILFAGGKVEFVSADGRLDNTSDKLLDKIEVYYKDPLNGTYLLSKTIDLHYSFPFHQGYYRMRLDSVSEIGGSLSKPPYSFEYDQSNLPPKNSTGQDHWGYYNGKDAVNTKLIPKMMVNNQLVGYADRTPSLVHAKAGALMAISYPTGGRTDFNFELNTYDSMGVEITAGGLRVKSIISTDQITGSTTKKSYNYNNSGKLQFGPPTYDYTVEMRTHNLVGLACLLDQSWNYTTIGQSPIFSRWNISAPVHYTFVTEYVGDEVNNAGKTDTYFSYDPDGGVSSFPFPPMTDNSYKRGKPINSTVYSRVSTSEYDSVTRSQNLYTNWVEQTSMVKGLKVGRAIINGGGCWNQPQLNGPEFAVENFYTQAAFRYLVESTSTVFDQNSNEMGVTTRTQYFYENPEHLMPNKQLSFLEQDTIETRTVYPADLSSPALVHTAMKSQNIIVPIEQTTFRNSKLIGGNGTMYNIEDNFLVPIKIYSVATNSPLSSFQTTTDGVVFDPVFEERAVVNAYSSYARINQLTGNDGISKSYLWNNSYGVPIASVDGAAIEDVGFSSFEGATDEGNLNYTGTIFTGNAKTGGKHLSGTVSKSGLQASTSYEVRFWAKGSPLVNGSSPMQLETDANGWSHYRHEITSVTSITIDASGAGDLIDEVRMYPKGAMMTTYTYNSKGLLVAQTDINGRQVNYEYDELDRLVLQRDQDNNILQTYQYHYAGQ